MPLTALFAAGVVVLASCADAVPVEREEEQQRIRRLAPPLSLSCNRNDLTSYTGEVTHYVGDENSIAVVIRTDAGTVESVTLSGSDPASYFLVNGQPFGPDDWRRIVADDGQLVAGTRVTAWICLDGTTQPVLDWR